jgi:hypothetical protein
VTTTTTVATARQTSTSTDANSTLDKVIVVFAQQPSSLASNIPLILGLAVPLCIITCAFIVLVVCLLRKKSPDDNDNDDDKHPVDRYAANNAQPEMVSARQDPATSSFYGTLGVGVSFLLSRCLKRVCVFVFLKNINLYSLNNHKKVLVLMVHYQSMLLRNLPQCLK